MEIQQILCLGDKVESLETDLCILFEKGLPVRDQISVKIQSTMN